MVTIKVIGVKSEVNPSGEVIINAKDFDSAKYQLVNETDAELVKRAQTVVTPAAATAAGGANIKEMAELKQKLDDCVAANASLTQQLTAEKAKVAELEFKLDGAHMTVQEIKEALDKAKVDYAPNANKADLLALFKQVKPAK